MKNRRILYSAILTMMASSAMGASRLADTTRVHNLGEVVVTGSNQATSRNLLPYTVSVVSSRQLEATGHTQLLSAISGEVPSLFVSQRNMFGFGVSNGGSGGIKIRGVGGSPTNSILMMVDGQPQFAGLYSHPVADGVAHQNYALLGLRLTYRPIRQLDIFAHFDNLTDAKYMINNGYQMPGFNVMGGVKVKL